MLIADLAKRTGVVFGTSGARGLVTRMTNEVCYAYVTAFLRVVSETRKVVVGHDLRPSSPSIAAACLKAARDTGCEVSFAGAIPTPALAYYGRKNGSSGIVVTGSHIPFERNGIKFYRPTGEITKADECAIAQVGVGDLERVMIDALPPVDCSAHHMYVARYVEFFGEGALSGIRVAIYEHSSVARDILKEILYLMGAEVISLGRTESFVPIDTEAVRPEDSALASKWAAEYNFDAIVSTDGDADRPLLGDEEGKWLRGDAVGILCAEFLEAQVVVTPVSSNTAVEKCAMFERIVRTRIGSPYVIEGMEHGALQGAEIVVGYEANGGFLLGSDVARNGRWLAALPTRDAMLPILALLVMARERRCKLSELSEHLPKRYTHSGRIQNFPTDSANSLLEGLSAHPEDAAATLAPNSGGFSGLDLTDGLRMTFANGEIVHLRPSGNAPEIRCYAEADSSARAKDLCEDCLRRITDRR